MTAHTKAAQLHAIDQANYFHPFTDLHEYEAKGGGIYTSAEHIYIEDINGRKLLDGMSGLWCCNLGYTQPAIVEAVTEQLNKLPYYNSFFNCTNDAAIEMTAALVDILPDSFNHVFYTNSGSEGNDTNIRLVHRYFDLLGKPEKKLIIGRNNGYHGSTIAGASLGGMSGMHKQFTALPYVHHVQQPHWFEEGGDLDKNSFGVQAARALETKIEELGADKVAAFIAEPIQGAGGVIVPPDTYWPEIQRICDEHDILLISDEVICGFGRTGSWFGCETFGYKPDLMTFAKAVTNGFQPLGGVAIGDKVADVLAGGGGEFAHGFTYSGHPAACAAGIATLKILKEGDYIRRVAEDIGPYMESKWLQLADHPIVGETRFKGMVAAIELVKDKSSRERLAPESAGALFCRDAAVANGLMVRQVGDAMISAPPLVCSKQEIDMLMQRLVTALDATAAQYGVA
jgi:putrescine aminotransferase